MARVTGALFSAGIPASSHCWKHQNFLWSRSSCDSGTPALQLQLHFPGLFQQLLNLFWLDFEMVIG
jgi:hypothetical protein